jgi:hypothetical protein
MAFLHCQYGKGSAKKEGKAHDVELDYRALSSLGKDCCTIMQLRRASCHAGDLGLGA